jgi:hypothetical protein
VLGLFGTAFGLVGDGVSSAVLGTIGTIAGVVISEVAANAPAAGDDMFTTTASLITMITNYISTSTTSIENAFLANVGSTTADAWVSAMNEGFWLQNGGPQGETTNDIVEFPLHIQNAMVNIIVWKAIK